jgi:hypothetical protein
MSEIKNITVRQVEGPARKRIAREVANVYQADAVLREISKTVPDGCYKVDIIFEYEDGCTLRYTLCIRKGDIDGGVRRLLD